MLSAAVVQRQHACLDPVGLLRGCGRIERAGVGRIHAVGGLWPATIRLALPTPLLYRRQRKKSTRTQR